MRTHKHTLGVAAAAVLLGLTAVASSSAQSGIHIDNFARVTASYYRGAQPDGQDYADLAALGVKTIINLIGDGPDAAEPAFVSRSGMKYVHIPMTTHTAPTPAQLSQFLTLVNDPASQPVYVHCVGGKHRTGVMTAVYRMTGEGWSADRAFAEMKQYKFGADFLHAEFKRFVYDYPAQHAHAAEAVTAAASATKADAKR